MRNHTLILTIAKANRVFSEKVSGFTVDYALKFDNSNDAKDIIKNKSCTIGRISIHGKMDNIPWHDGHHRNELSALRNTHILKLDVDQEGYDKSMTPKKPYSPLPAISILLPKSSGRLVQALECFPWSIYPRPVVGTFN